jgi:TolB-like protein
VAWLVIQVVETIFPAFGFGDAAIRGVVIFLAIGFFPAVISAWAFELTPDGLVRDSEVDRSSPTIQAMGKRLDRLVIVALALALGYFALDKFLLDPARDEAREQAIAEAARAQGRDEAIRETEAEREGRPMVAVLPFATVGGGEESGFFAAGVHDDLLTRLAQLQSVRVISRTSVMEYRETDRNIREIGAALGADVILEGGVQSAGERIRINAQLIDAGTDEHLWAETYDRELTIANIFDVQTDIARAITTALRATLTDQDDATLSVIPTENMAAYRAFRRAMEIADSSPTWQNQHYREALEEAVELDPGFTRAWAELAGYLAHANFYFEHDPELTRQAEEVLAHLKAIAPDSADYLMAQTFYVYYIVRDYDAAIALADRALARAPSDTRILAVKSWIQRRQGDVEGRLDTLRLITTLDPRDRRYALSRINTLMLLRRFDEARVEQERVDFEDTSLSYWRYMLDLREHRDLGRWADDVIALMEPIKYERGALEYVWLAHVAKRDFAGAEALVEAMPEPDTSRGHEVSYYFSRFAFRIPTLWLLGREEDLAEVLAAARSAIDALEVPDNLVLDYVQNLDMAMVTAAEGDARDTERRIGLLLNSPEQDLASRPSYLQTACHLLGMAGAAEAAVNCIRTALNEKSPVMPFLDPYLAFFDPIREEPVFVELLAELDNQG